MTNTGNLAALAIPGLPHHQQCATLSAKRLAGLETYICRQEGEIGKLVEVDDGLLVEEVGVLRCITLCSPAVRLRPRS